MNITIIIITIIMTPGDLGGETPDQEKSSSATESECESERDALPELALRLELVLTGIRCYVSQQSP